MVLPLQETLKEIKDSEKTVFYSHTSYLKGFCKDKKR